MMYNKTYNVIKHVYKQHKIKANDKKWINTYLELLLKVC